MKKPKIESMLGGIFVNKNMVKEEHVEEMVDALLETRTQLTIAMSHEDAIPTKVLVDWCTKVEKALEIAGCKYE